MAVDVVAEIVIHRPRAEVAGSKDLERLKAILEAERHR